MIKNISNKKNDKIPSKNNSHSEEKKLITFTNFTYSLPDGNYAARVIQSRITMNGRWLIGFQLNDQSTEFVTTFPLPLNKSCPFGREIYDACNDIDRLVPDDLLNCSVKFKIKNSISKDRTYSNIIEFSFNGDDSDDEEEDDEDDEEEDDE